MKNKGKVNVILDIVMFLVMLSIFCVKGNLHETFAYTIGGLVIIHLVLHWEQFTAMYRKLIPEARYQRLVAVLAGVLVIAILTAPLYWTVDRPGQNGNFGPPDRYYSE
ncbi:MAG: hypothetical protein ABFC94_12765 [Syntrophomonas sp.]